MRAPRPAAETICSTADQAAVTPDVEIAPLPGVVPNILASLAAHAPTTGTPTSAALQGAITHAVDWARLPANADHVTSGRPRLRWRTIGLRHRRFAPPGNAETAATGTPTILTFVIGVGDQIAVLDDIAAGGGTGKAHFVDTDVNAGQAFLDALNEVRVKALGCVYSIPAPNGEKPKYTEVNVSYTPSDGSPAEISPKVRGQADCAENVDGWYETTTRRRRKSSCALRRVRSSRPARRRISTSFSDARRACGRRAQTRIEPSAPETSPSLVAETPTACMAETMRCAG